MTEENKDFETEKNHHHNPIVRSRRVTNADMIRHNPDYNYARDNKIHARSVGNARSHVWRVYNDLVARRDDPMPENEKKALDQNITDMELAIASMDFLEEMASYIFWARRRDEFDPNRRVDMKNGMVACEKHMMYAKRGGRFRRNNPPKSYILNQYTPRH